jgi:hypothetical protein
MPEAVPERGPPAGGATGSSRGSAGCDSTGASTDFSSIIDSAKLPVKHMPMAPTPGPPHSLWACAARARNHTVTGLDSFAAKARNSRLTQARSKTTLPSLAVATAPSRPNRLGIHTVNPATRTHRANRATCGLIPGISAITNDGGAHPGDVDAACLAEQRHVPVFEVLKGVVFVQTAQSHGSA